MITPTMLILQQKLKTVQNIYKLLTTEFTDLPKFVKSKHVVHSFKYEMIKDKNRIIKVNFTGTCNDKMGRELAHTHTNPNDQFYQRICYKRKYLLALPLVTPIRSWKYQQHERTIMFESNGKYNSIAFYGDLYWNSLAELTAHEASHLVVRCHPGSNGHCRAQKLRSRLHQEFLRKCELDGRLHRCVIGKNIPVRYEMLSGWNMPH